MHGSHDQQSTKRLTGSVGFLAGILLMASAVMGVFRPGTPYNAAAGITLGDIGTSRFYYLNEIFFPEEEKEKAVPVNRDNVVGVVSASTYMFAIVFAMYLIFALRRDYKGQGGTQALRTRVLMTGAKGSAFIAGLLLLGTGFLMGDGSVTPGISLLGGLDGTKVLALEMERIGMPAWVIAPVTFMKQHQLWVACLILTLIWRMQLGGTKRIGSWFGPITIWLFLVPNTIIDLMNVWQQPEILHALNPWEGMRYLIEGGMLPSKVKFFGGAMLMMTGCEAFYADLGHFNKHIVRVTGTVATLLILPAGFGQGAFLLSGNPVMEDNIYYSGVNNIVGQWGLIVMIPINVVESIIATVEGTG